MAPRYQKNRRFSLDHHLYPLQTLRKERFLLPLPTQSRTIPTMQTHPEINTVQEYPQTFIRGIANRYLRFIVIGAIALIVTANTGFSDVIYRQVFGNASGSWKSPKALGIDWSSWLTIDNYEGYWVGMGVSPNASLSGTSENVGNAKPSPAGNLTNGCYSVNIGCASVYTDSMTLDPTFYSMLQFSWLQSNGLWKKDPEAADATSVRLLIRQGGVWYVSKQSFCFADKDAHPVQITYSPEASEWLILSSGARPSNANYATLSASPASNLTGTITEFGVVAYTPKKYWTSIDDFSVSATKAPRP